MYKLAGTWPHGNDVKAVKFGPHGLLAAGRDGKLVQHTQNGSEVLYETGQFLNSLAVSGDSAIVGAQDATIVAIDLNTKAQIYYLGHTANVCSLDASDSLLVSGSWDKTARIWSSPDSFVELAGHTEAVWAVQIVDSNHVLTASADKTIILWENGKQKRKFTGHTDPVRGLCLLDGNRFASCANDYTIKIWSFDGALLHTLDGHTSFVYSLAYHKGLLFSTGEDRTLRVWRENELVQSIVLPGISVWSVAVNKTGDIAVGASDRKARLFSAKPSSWLSDSELQAFEDEVSNVAVGEDQVQFDEKQLQPASILETAGKEGQVVMVRTNSIVEAHQFSGGKWQRIGEVVGQRTEKKQFAGQAFDYLFDVDIADGVPPLKLPFNKGDNVYSAAEKFVDDNELPVTYVGQVADFLIKNTQGTETSAPAPTPSKSLPKSSLIATYNKPVFMTNMNKESLAKAFSEKAAEQGSVQVNLLPLLEGLPNTAQNLLETAQSAAEHWNPANLLPALDALRLAVAYIPEPPSAQVLIALLSCADPAMPKHAALAARGFANIVARPDGKAIVQKNQQVFTQALDLFENTSEMPAPLGLAAATLVLNLAVVDPGTSIAPFSVKLANMLGNNDEANYRLALAIGVQAFRHPSDRETLSQAKQWLTSASSSPRIREVAEEIALLF